MQAFWMILSALLFASMGVCVKFASAWFTSAELVFWRGLIGIALLAWMAQRKGISLRTRYPGMHAWRSFIGVVSLGAWFYAIAHLPLASAMTLNYMSSVWVAVFLIGGTLLTWVPVPGRDGRLPRPPLQTALLITVLLGFTGVIIMLRPSLGEKQAFAGLVGLLSGMCAAFAYLQVVALSRLGEPEERTVFYFAVGSGLMGAGVALVEGFSPWPGLPALWLLPLGILAALGQLCMTRAFAAAQSQGGTLLVANLQYSGIVFAAIYSMTIFGDRIDALGWAGMALIVVSGIAATLLRSGK